jgi:hypothetical protein
MFLLDCRVASMIALQNFSSRRSLNLKYFAPPMTDSRRLGCLIFHTLSNSFSSLSGDVLMSQRTYYSRWVHKTYNIQSLYIYIKRNFSIFIVKVHSNCTMLSKTNLRVTFCKIFWAIIVWRNQLVARMMIDIPLVVVILRLDSVIIPWLSAPTGFIFFYFYLYIIIFIFSFLNF